MFQLCNRFCTLEEILCDIPFVKKGKKTWLTNVPITFDIEASSFYAVDENGEYVKRACMYAWVFGINGKCIRGRTWDEFITLLNYLKDYYIIDERRHLVIFVHNLSYEFQWFRKLFTWQTVFNAEDRKPIYAITVDGIEFRCSYMLSNLSLAKVGENLLKYKVQKMIGDLDYRLIRHSTTPLTDKEWGYILNDGLVVMAYIQELLEQYGSIANLPHTKTGFVRNLCREACLKGENKFDYAFLMKNLTLGKVDYEQLKRAFAGGYTHGNHNNVGKIMEKVDSYDFTSSYIAVMLSEKFPMSKPIYWAIQSKQDFIDKLNKYNCIFDITFNNIRAKVDYEHYISKSKCYYAENYVLDNGRIVEATKIQTTITEVDFYIITKCYEWDTIEVGNFRYYFKDYLPEDFIRSILKLYKDKTELKDVKGKEVEYINSKGNANSSYGMTVTDPCKDEIIYDNEQEWIKNTADVEALLDEYNKSTSRFLYYPWGVWITAYSRRNLWSGIFELKNDYIYSDTDSLKFINLYKHKKYFEEYNIKILEKIKRCLSKYEIPFEDAKPKTIKGVEKPLGVWDYEGHYKYFKTLGAKRYMYIDMNDELHITISGVSKKCGVAYLKYKFKDNLKILRAFNDDLEFPAEYEVKENGQKVIKQGTGKLTHTYLDDYTAGYVVDYLGNEGYYEEFSSIHMEATGYSLSLDDTFKQYLFGVSASFLTK